MAIVLGRFGLGVSGPFAAWVLDPRDEVMLVVLLTQVWSIGVAFVQFNAAPRLLALAVAPIAVAVVVVLYPFLIGPHGLAIGAALILLAAILFIIARHPRPVVRPVRRRQAQQGAAGRGSGRPQHHCLRARRRARGPPRGRRGQRRQVAVPGQYEP